MPWVFDQFALDLERRQLLRAGSPVALEPKAYELLSLLLARRPGAISKAQIRDVLWPGTFVSESALAGLITDLRSVLGDNARRPRFIRTVHGFGYAFSGDAREDGQAAEATSGPILRTLVLSNGGSVQWFDRPTAALIAALADTAGAAVHVVEFTPGARPPGFLQKLAWLAEPRQVLLSRAAFDLARDAADSSDDGLVWLAHGPYLFDGLRDPLDVFEVGRAGRSLLRPPADTKSARRAVRPGDEVTLGWRPAPGLAVPGREGWTFVDKLGEGGYGEVWLAAHPAGERRVIKFCFDASRLRGLKREATLFQILKEELGDRDDIAKVLDWNFEEPPFFLESEYTDGGNLVEWAEAAGGIGAIPLDMRLVIIAQVAEALAAAHSVGVLHKDVKPQNVLITEDGEGKPKARLTDFGIGVVRDRSVLLGRDFTVTGFTEATEDTGSRWSGTRLYAAPELLEGRTPTTLADIYALGVMLYQTVVADLERALAPGWERDVADDLLKEDIGVCVEGRPDRRLGNAQTVADRLRSREQRRAEKRAGPFRKKRELVAWTLLMVTALASLVLAAVHFRQIPADVRSFRFSIPAPENGSFTGPVSVSPDGRQLAVVVLSSGITKLWVRSLDSPAAQPLEGTEGADGPFWSPDSRSIAFFAVGKLKRIDSAGGPVQTVCDAPNGSEGTWSRDGVILFTLDTWDSSLYRVAAEGGAPTLIGEPLPGQTAYKSPHFLPDGRHFVYAARFLPLSRTGIYVGSLDSKQTKWILNTIWMVAYAPAIGGGHGHLLFVRDGTLTAQPFDTNGLQLTGQPFAVADGQPTDTSRGAFFSVSMNGILAYSTNKTGATPVTLVWVDRQGKATPLRVPAGRYGGPRVSPDGQKLSMEINNGITSDIWIYDLTRAVFARLTYDGTSEGGSLVWSPDSKRVFFSSRRPGPLNLYVQDADGKGPAERMLPGPNAAMVDSLSRDGRTLIFTYMAPMTSEPDAVPITGENGEIWAVQLHGARKPQPLVRGPHKHWGADLSPDGRWLAYLSDESGQFEVYVTSYPSLQGKWQVSTGWGTEVRWAPDGRELYWRSNDRMMAASINTQRGFSASQPRILFSEYLSGVPGLPQYDVARDGRFLMLKAMEAATDVTHINVASNWVASVKSSANAGTR